LAYYIHDTIMPAPISIRLDDDVRATLEAEARSRGVGLATYLRQIAAEAARNVRRARIRAQSAAVGRSAVERPVARDFYQEWGTPTTDAE
jgi:GNAT superfamily N-acetyltransferase